MHKIAVIGDENSVYGFSALGIETYFSDSPEDAKHIIGTLIKEDFAIIYVTEELVSGLGDTIDEVNNLPYPCIIPIPSANGSTGIGKKMLSERVIKAVGSEI